MEFVERQIYVAAHEARQGFHRWIHLTPEETPRFLEVWLRRKFPGQEFEIERHFNQTLLRVVGV